MRLHAQVFRARFRVIHDIERLFVQRLASKICRLQTTEIRGSRQCDCDFRAHAPGHVARDAVAHEGGVIEAGHRIAAEIQLQRFRFHDVG